MGNATTKNNEDPGRGRKSSLKSQQDETKDSASGIEGTVCISYRTTLTILSWLSLVCLYRENVLKYSHDCDFCQGLMTNQDVAKAEEAVAEARKVRFTILNLSFI